MEQRSGGRSATGVPVALTDRVNKIHAAIWKRMPGSTAGRRSPSSSSPRPDPVTIRLNEFGLKMVLWGKERVLPDPKITTPEKHRRKAARAAAPAA